MVSVLALTSGAVWTGWMGNHGCCLSLSQEVIIFFCPSADLLLNCPWFCYRYPQMKRHPVISTVSKIKTIIQDILDHTWQQVNKRNRIRDRCINRHFSCSEAFQQPPQIKFWSPQYKNQQEILTLIQVKPIRAVGNTAIGYFIQVVARFTGHALVTMAAKTGFTIGWAFFTSFLVCVVVTRWAGRNTDPADSREEKAELLMK